MQEGGLGGILRRPNLPEAAGWLLCKRSYPHETTQWQRRDWVILILWTEYDWVILILWTEYDWGESHPSSLAHLQGLACIFCLACHAWLHGNCQLLLISCFEEVRVEVLLKCARSHDAKRSIIYTRYEIHWQWIRLKWNNLKIELHL